MASASAVRLDFGRKKCGRVAVSTVTFNLHDLTRASSPANDWGNPQLNEKGILMRKTVAAAVAGLLLVGGQAAAAGATSAVVRVGDRVGAQAESDSQFAGLRLPGLLIGAAVIAATIVLASNDDSESD